MNNRFEKYFFVVIIISFSSRFAFAQENEFYSRSKPHDFKKDAHFDSINNLIHYKKNVIYIEGLGNAGYGFCSINYERKIGENKNGFATTRIGFSYPQKGHLVFPFLINQVFNQQQSNHFELGVGMTIALVIDKQTRKIEFNHYFDPCITANFMYRHQKPGESFIIRVGWTPVIYPKASSLVFVMYFLDFGFSLGYAF